MQKKLTITLDDRIYRGLHEVVGRRRISQFIEGLVRPHVLRSDLDRAYRDMARDESREAEALEWSEATVGDVADEARRGLVGQLRTLRRRRSAKTAARRDRQQRRRQ